MINDRYTQLQRVLRQDVADQMPLLRSTIFVSGILSKQDAYYSSKILKMGCYRKKMLKFQTLKGLVQPGNRQIGDLKSGQHLPQSL